MALIWLLVGCFLHWPCGVRAFLLGSCCFFFLFSGVMFQAGFGGFCLKLQWVEEFPLTFQLLFESSQRVFGTFTVFSWLFFNFFTLFGLFGLFSGSCELFLFVYSSGIMLSLSSPLGV